MPWWSNGVKPALQVVSGSPAIKARPAPLAGTLVVDLTRHLPGPLAAHLLADLGARVVKVEEPRLGDPVRQAPPSKKGVGALAALLLSGVESVALDLRQPAGQEVLQRLLERADVLLESFRPGTLERFGFSPRFLQERYPRLIVCSLSGYGQTGPAATAASAARVDAARSEAAAAAEAAGRRGRGGGCLGGCC